MINGKNPLLRNGFGALYLISVYERPIGVYLGAQRSYIDPAASRRLPDLCIKTSATPAPRGPQVQQTSPPTRTPLRPEPKPARTVSSSRTTTNPMTIYSILKPSMKNA
ncbi:hypothetical protein TcasGA2_TC004124 [Tribolium castaneum]|uniref:Uncharacterized protein n=1 Tax=Tribolium castaneum TaxID=7070 RepID=D6W6P1_TRICA|nr:hypothetical protein TcasGA2_TC004124 [Tribolium castaneum]